MPNSNTQPIGKVSIVPRDAWSNSQQYYRLDLVTYQGGSYLAKSDNKNVTPTNTNTWLKIAEKGDKGDTGDPAATADVEAWLEDNIAPISSVLTLPNWSDAETYAVNNVVLYTTNNKIYRCHTAVETAGTLPTNTDYWSEIVVASIIDSSLSITGAVADAKKTGELAAPVFSSSTAYSSGQYVLYNGQLYRFTSDHAAGAWTGSDAIAVNLGGEVSTLKSAIKYDAIIGSDLTWERKTITDGGQESNTNSAILSPYIPVYHNSIIYNGIERVSSAETYALVCEFDNEKTFIKRSTFYSTVDNVSGFFTFTSKNCAFIRVIFGHPAITGTQMNLSDAEYFVAEFGDFYDDYLEDVDNLTETVFPLNIQIHEPTNKLNKDALTSGILKANGTTEENNNRMYSDFIPISEGDKVYLIYFTESSSDYIVIKNVAAYDSDKIILSAKGTDTEANSYTVPAGVSFVRVTFITTYASGNLMLTINIPKTYAVWEEYYNPYATANYNLLTEDTQRALSSVLSDLTDTPYSGNLATLTGDTVMRVIAPDIKRNYTISFVGDITTMGTLYVGNGKNASYLGGWLEIDSTNLKVYTKPGASDILVGTYPHGLNLVGKINVCINAKKWMKADIIITASGDANTQGGTFVQSDVDWFGNYGFTFANPTQGRITAQTSGGTFTNCSLKYYSSDQKHELWGFGDSYFDHWVSLAIQDGYGNWMIDGASGRASADAFASLKVSLQKRMPKKILWAMGMNDEDSSSAVNSSWYNNYIKLKDLCEKNDIELILVTIPCNDRRNDYKNAIIKASGLRYVDIANAVGGEEVNSSWYAGLLSSDNVHPTALGDKVIAARFMADVPEMMEVY